jgi:hypothetical protein
MAGVFRVLQYRAKRGSGVAKRGEQRKLNLPSASNGEFTAIDVLILWSRQYLDNRRHLLGGDWLNETAGREFAFPGCPVRVPDGGIIGCSRFDVASRQVGLDGLAL